MAIPTLAGGETQPDSFDLTEHLVVRKEGTIEAPNWKLIYKHLNTPGTPSEPLMGTEESVMLQNFPHAIEWARDTISQELEEREGDETYKGPLEIVDTSELKKAIEEANEILSVLSWADSNKAEAT